MVVRDGGRLFGHEFVGPLRFTLADEHLGVLLHRHGTDPGRRVTVEQRPEVGPCLPGGTCSREVDGQPQPALEVALVGLDELFEEARGVLVVGTALVDASESQQGGAERRLELERLFEVLDGQSGRRRAGHVGGDIHQQRRREASVSSAGGDLRRAVGGNRAGVGGENELVSSHVAAHHLMVEQGHREERVRIGGGEAARHRVLDPAQRPQSLVRGRRPLDLEELAPRGIAVARREQAECFDVGHSGPPLAELRLRDGSRGLVRANRGVSQPAVGDPRRRSVGGH